MLKKKRIIIFLIIILLVSSFLSFTIGQMKIELSELFDPYTQLVIFQFRLPRLLCAILVGGGMALAGHILQTVLQNDLADPGVIGINSGISFFVLLYILVSGTDIFLDYVWMPLAGMIGAVITIGLLMFLIYEKERGIDPIRMTIPRVNSILLSKAESSKVFVCAIMECWYSNRNRLAKNSFINNNISDYWSNIVEISRCSKYFFVRKGKCNNLGG